MKLCKPLSLGLCLVLALSVSANAADYRFDGVENTQYYPSTGYENVYGSAYNYGGRNAVDYQLPQLPYGMGSSTGIGPMERVSGGSITVSSGPVLVSKAQPLIYQPAAFTDTSGMERLDGSIGTVTIPALALQMKVWKGETNDSMAKGLGHYTTTSAWDGNVGVCGHNRGAKYAIGSIKDLSLGDTITYSTVYGTRTYAVTYVGTISNTDWSYLQATADNRLTLTTCLADQPAYRVVVQAVEMK